MRFLKRKIARATGLPLCTPSPQAPDQVGPESPVISLKKPSHPNKTQELRLRPELPSQLPQTTKKQLSGDNIMKNYGRAMTNFALSRVAQMYLNPFTM